MNSIEHEMAQTWVRTWQRAGPVLKQIKAQELKSFDYDRHITMIDDMLQWAYNHQTPRLTSGLVEQQYWFMKMRDKLLEQQHNKGEDNERHL